MKQVQRNPTKQASCLRSSLPALIVLLNFFFFFFFFLIVFWITDLSENLIQFAGTHLETIPINIYREKCAYPLSHCWKLISYAWNTKATFTDYSGFLILVRRLCKFSGIKNWNIIFDISSMSAFHFNGNRAKTLIHKVLNSRAPIARNISFG